jgi:hypothetical protein
MHTIERLSHGECVANLVSAGLWVATTGVQIFVRIASA